MEESSRKEEGQELAPVEEKQRYIGSVRFFKHMILLIIAALITIPAVLFAVVFCKYEYLQKKYIILEKEFMDYVCQAEGQQGGQNAAVQDRQDATVQEQRERQDAVTQEEQAVMAQRAQAELEHSKDDEMVVQLLGTETSQIPFEVDLNKWNYLLINEKNPLPQDFEPMLTETRNGKKVDRRIKYNLERMLDAAEESGLKLVICSAYRNYEKQDELIDESIAEGIHKGMSYEEAFYEAKKQLGRIGCSEHHTGLAVDLVGENYQSLDSGQAKTKEAQWLKEHACEYGFILRYPKDKEEITGIEFESWHFRYVGADAAMYMKENNLCLEEFMELAVEQQGGEI